MRGLLIAALGAGALLAASPSAAQAPNFDGQWYGREEAGQTVTEVTVTIAGGHYITTVTRRTPNMAGGTAQYLMTHSGTVTFHEPDTLRFVVQNWSPRKYLGRDMLPPPNGNYRVVSFDGATLVLIDNVCTMTHPQSVCTSILRRR